MKEVWRKTREREPERDRGVEREKLGNGERLRRDVGENKKEEQV